ncbi:MAG: hypothetical protein GX973_07050 [Firmicutes bacterium]|nr:hypothetical protein [Bacillota bacterium]
MAVSINKLILAVVTLNHDLVSGGGAPVFLAEDQAELDRISTYLSRITGGVTHDLENGVYIVVRH